MKRKAFIDWSGNLGFKFETGSSRFLTFALLICDDYTALREAWRQFKQSRSISLDFEFHYNGLPRKLRTAVFAWLQTQATQIRIGVLTIDKTRLPRQFRRLNEIDATSYFVAQMVALASNELNKSD